MTFNNILAGILSIQWFIVASLVVCFALSIWLVTLGSRSKKGLSSYGWQALFVGMDKRRCLFLSTLILQTLFAVSGALGNMQVTPVTGGSFLGLTLLAIIIEKKPEGIMEHVVFTVMGLAALAAGNLLRDFMEDTGIDWYILTVYILLLIFELQFALYHLVKGIERMTVKNELVAKPKRKTNNTFKKKHS